ncbi:MAG: DUF5009 domain-containing protein [Thermoguttaceae bacterium]|nr:DUF5009 domain-containing protein [Thermoguttaceae bacterium]MBQ1863910.1 DUF5009 domain-containing protein [Thermoguttaceae bacterium]MBQ2556971.1 DUF5009 domain-containing protein [Thermoguttaceae bacterium]MBQ4195794.1 DUF5009 domain-containing protein [Thermoguttaceae bacterium]MBQ4203288.1 DUF5009 domain-containing protein [Thermoguttaceae bacterium]
MSAAEAADLKPPVAKTAGERLVALDALRGFDILLLLLLGVVSKFANGPMPGLIEGKSEACVNFCNKFVSQFHHIPWEGFTLCDLAMPLFVFMAGAAIPFSLARYLRGDDKRWGRLWFRIIRRVVVLWIFGMAVQGHLLSLHPEEFKLFSNTLQSIAVGYLFSCLAYLFLPKWAQRGLFVLLLIAFWAAMKFITVGGDGNTEGITEWTMNWINARGCGGGSYAEGTNLAYWVDCRVLGKWMDAASVNEAGEVVFAPWYQYTWILSSLTFVATALSGMFAGDLFYGTRERLKTFVPGDVEGRKRVQWTACAYVFAAGCACLFLGRLWNSFPEGSLLYCPIIKHIWTSSMVLHASGISLLLLAVFYAVFDIWKIPGLKTFLVVFGTNAIAAYMLSHILKFDEIVGWVLYGLERYIGSWYEFTLSVAGVALIWLILHNFWKQGKFLRV